ncbi:hypothetical protein ES703_81583 [subsurface metagenome]
MKKELIICDVCGNEIPYKYGDNCKRIKHMQIVCRGDRPRSCTEDDPGT